MFGVIFVPFFRIKSCRNSVSIICSVYTQSFLIRNGGKFGLVVFLIFQLFLYGLCFLILPQFLYSCFSITSEAFEIAADLTDLQFPRVLEIPASRVFLGTEAQLLGTSLAGARMSWSKCLQSLLELDIHSLASHCLALCYWDLIYKSLAFISYKSKTD